ncbi:MAG TPA: preprotein translocase subunit YajC [Anaerolineae bacterium]|nr:preprotein translocase subunit YajC [Anaerolineae bacterium]
MDSQTFLLLVLIVGMGAFTIWAQYRTKKRYQKRLEELQVGDPVITIGGIYGKLTRLDRETNRARLEVAPGVEIEISLRAISGRVGPTGEEE